MQILSIEIFDILSIQNASLTFEESGLVLVEGWNFDTQRANGAGKTAIFNCLSFALYDKLPRKVTASEIVRRGCKSGSVSVKVLCGEDIWTVCRSRPKGVKFLKNDLEQEITQAEFESNIRLNYSQFLLTMYTPQANSGHLERFINSPDSEKKSFLLQLLNLENFSECKQIADEKIKDLVSKVDQINTKINTNKSKIDAYEESLVDCLSTQVDVDKINDSLLVLEKQLIEYSAVSKPDLSKYSKVEDDLKNKQSAIIQAKTKRSIYHDSYRELSLELSDYDPDCRCNECGSSLDSEQARIAHQDYQDQVKLKISNMKKQIDNCDSIIDKETSIIDLSKKLKDKKNKESADYQEASLRSLEIGSLIKSHKNKIDSLKLKIKSNQDLQNKIDSLNTVIENLSLDLSNNKANLDIYKTLSAIYSPTGAQAYILDSIVDSFNETVPRYIDLLSPNMSYVLNSYKENSKGDLIAKFSETLVMNGEEVSVGSLSGGEQKGLSLCIDFSLIEILENQFGMSLNPIILDEPFDGLDISGREIVLDLLESLAKKRQILIIDHSSEIKVSFTKTISVSLRNKISSVNCDL